MGIFNEKLENLSKSSDQLSEVLNGTRKSLSLLEKETWINFFKKAGDWFKKLLGLKSDDTPESSTETTNTTTSTQHSNTSEHTSPRESVDTSKTFGIAKDGGNYTAENSYTNSKTGIKYKLYDQTKGPRASYRYDSTRTVSNNGCMLTSAAVIASSLGNYNITPGDLFQNTRHRHAFVRKSVPEQSGGKLKSNNLTIGQNTNNEIVESLKKGNPAIIMVKGKNKGGESKFTSSQHYMALLDISDDGSKIFIGNSCTGLGGRRSSNGWYPTTDVLTSVREATLFTQA